MIREILKWPDNRLRKKCTEVTVFDEKLNQLIIDLHQTMGSTNKQVNMPDAAGLSAPQIGVFQRVFVYELEGKPTCMINPVILEQEGEQYYSEGCLSFPGVYIKVKRAHKILVEFQDVDGNKNRLKTDGFIARIIQHEIDHLNGQTYLKELSKVKRDLITRKMKKIKKKTERMKKEYEKWAKDQANDAQATGQHGRDSQTDRPDHTGICDDNSDTQSDQGA